jgi:nucleoside phosphorylase
MYENLLEHIASLPAGIRAHAIEVVLENLAREDPTLVAVARDILLSSSGPERERLIRAVASMPSTSDAEAEQIVLAAPDRVDVLILTIKPTELDACLRAFGVPASRRGEMIGRSGIFVWTVDVDGLRVAISMVGAAGNTETAIAVNTISQHVDFGTAVLVGMCAGNSDEVRLGTVVVASTVVDYTFQRMTEDGAEFESRPRTPPERHLRGAAELEGRFHEFSSAIKSQIEDFALEFPSEEPETIELWSPKFKRTGVLAGGWLIEDGGLAELSKSHGMRLSVAEMEGAGFALSCEEHSVPWMVVRGVADYGGPDRRKHWQWPATYMAAAVVKELISARSILGLNINN